MDAPKITAHTQTPAASIPDGAAVGMPGKIPGKKVGKRKHCGAAYQKAEDRYTACVKRLAKNRSGI